MASEIVRNEVAQYVISELQRREFTLVNEQFQRILAIAVKQERDNGAAAMASVVAWECQLLLIGKRANVVDLCKRNQLRNGAKLKAHLAKIGGKLYTDGQVYYTELSKVFDVGAVKAKAKEIIQAV